MVVRPDIFADTPHDIAIRQMDGLAGAGLSLTWLAISIAVFLWRFREWRNSRYINFIIW